MRDCSYSKPTYPCHKDKTINGKCHQRQPWKTHLYGHSAVFETVSPVLQLMWLVSRFDTPSLLYSGTMCVRFWYHMFGVDIGQLRVYRTSQGQSQLVYPLLSADQGNVWRQASATVNSFSYGDRVSFMLWTLYSQKPFLSICGLGVVKICSFWHQRCWIYLGAPREILWNT